MICEGPTVSYLNFIWFSTIFDNNFKACYFIDHTKLNVNITLFIKYFKNMCFIKDIFIVVKP